MIMLAIGRIHLVIALFHFKPFNIHSLENLHTKAARLLRNAV